MSGGGGGQTVTQQNYSPEEAAQRAALQQEAKSIYDTQTGSQRVFDEAGYNTALQRYNQAVQQMTPWYLEGGGIGMPSIPMPNREDFYRTISGENQWQTYPGSPPIPASEETTQAEAYLRQLVPGQIQNVSDIQRATSFGLHDVLYPGTNPALQQTINAAVRPITESYTDPGGVLAQIRQGAQNAGQVGSSRQGIAEGIAAGRYANAIGDVSAKIATEGYNQGLDTFGRTLAFAPSALATGTVPAQTLANVGASVESRAAEQAAFDEQQRLWQLNAPWNALQNYANMVYGSPSLGGTATSSGPGRSTGQRLASGLGGAAAGYQIGTGVGAMMASSGAGAAGGAAGGASAGSSAGPWGAAIGALIGLMMS